MGKNLKGFIFTFDALLAVIIVAIFLTYLLSIQVPASPQLAKGQLAEDILTIYEKESLPLPQIRNIFITTNSCGIFTLYNSSDITVQNTSVCECSKNLEVRKRSIIQITNSTVEEYLAEVKIC